MEETAAALFAGLDVAGSPRDLVALGGRLDVETLVAAYRAGCFPWPATGPYEAPLDRDARRLAHHGAVPVLPGTDYGASLLGYCRVRSPRSRSHQKARWVARSITEWTCWAQPL